MTRHTPHLDRRTALRTVAGAALASVAGCLDDPADDGTSPTDGQRVLKRVAVVDTAVVVNLASETDVDQINLIQPDGKLYGQRDVAAGVHQVSFDIGTTYTPGQYDVVALDGDETVEESTLSVEPNLRIMEMGTGRNQPEQMWDGAEDEISDEAFVTVENQGSGPDSVTKLLFIGDIPYPSDEEGTNYANTEDISGIYSPQVNSEVDDVLVPAGEQVTVYSSRSPFAFVPGAGTSCSDGQRTGEFEVILETRVGENRVSKTYSIQYAPSEKSDRCDIAINEA